jgi:BirA family biotin operon repressor/biotin-[acetyl-CoA-carboxylase] ligase
VDFELLNSIFPDWKIKHISILNEFQFSETYQSKLIIVVDQIPSTREWVKSWTTDQLTMFSQCLVVGVEQTAGQGRMDRRWFASPEASLTFNYLCDIPSSLNPGLLSLLAAWAQLKIYRDLYHVAELDLKWPNDVLLGNKKCSGSLMEILKTRNGQKLSLGLGVNIGKMEFPSELEQISTSLSQHSDEIPQREQVLCDLIQCFQVGMQRLDQPHWLLEDIQKASSYIKGAWLKYELNGEFQVGKSKGLTERGGLWIENERGVVREFYGSEIQRIRKG